MGRRLRLAMCLWLLVLVLVPIQAFGHTKLIEMNPQPDSQIELSPEHIHLQFSAKLEAVSGQTLYVEDEAGENIEAGPVQIGEDSKSVQLTLPQLQKGTYTVHYHVMSLDGHMVMGDYQFTVLANHEQAETEAPAGEHAEHEAPAEEPVDPEAPSETHVHPPEQPDASGDYGVTPVEAEEGLQVRWTSVFTEIEAVDVLRMVYFVIFLLLVGMMIWYVVLRRGKPDEDASRLRNWIMQIQRLHLLILIAVVAEFIQHAVGFDHMEQVQNILLHTTAGNAWSVLVVLSLIGLGVLQRNKIIDVVWILAVVTAMTQIGHSAASDHRMLASILIAIHLLAAALWAGGLLYLILLWKHYRHVAEKLILTFSNASLFAMTVLVLGGIASSLLYLTHISYVFETRWGFTLLLKIVAVVGVIVVGATIRRRFIHNGKLNVGAWIKLDFVLLIVIASLAALLSVAEPNPPNDPLHWHVMGEAVHMTAEITPRIPGDNRFVVSVWLPDGAGDPKDVSMQITKEPDGAEKTIALTEVEGMTNEYGFGGFNEFTFQAESGQLDRAGTWIIEVEVIDQQEQSWTFTKQIRVY